MHEPLRVVSLFAGIGGFDLGLERAGMRTVAFVEREPFCQHVLAERWPGVPIFDDVCSVGAGGLPECDVLCGGFPCQDISLAGRGAGIEGARSGLWAEFARLVRELRPRYVVVENVPALRSRGLWRVLADLASLGYDAEWDCLRASHFGAPHRRDRLWLVAYPGSEQSWRQGEGLNSEGRRTDAPAGRSRVFAYADDAGRAQQRQPFAASPEFQAVERRRQWVVEPDVGRVANGIPARVDRLKALGNALVPQVAEWIGHRIVAYEEGVRA